MVRSLIIFLSLLIISVNLQAQTADEWEDPYEKPGSPGFVEAYKAYTYGAMNNFKDARIWYEKATNKGNLFACCTLAKMLIEGIGGEKDVRKGIEYYISAANQGFAPAKFELGKIYFDGALVTKNLELAFGFFKSCVDVDKKYRAGKRALGICYLEGIGTSRNIPLGVNLLQELGLENDSQCQYILGNFYHSDAEYRNDKEAAKWYLMASANSRWEAQNNLALMYAKGEGVEQDFIKAHSFVKSALSNAIRANNTHEYQVTAQATLLDTEGEIFLIEGKKDEAWSIWNQIKSKHSDFVDSNKYNTDNFFVRTMYKEEHDKLLASVDKQQKESCNVISDVDNLIPENSIVGSPTFAVIIANENYTEVEKVSFALHDGETFKQYCEKTLGIPQSNIKFVADATLNNIKRQLMWLSQVMDVYQGEANVIFYYAGHGVPDESNRSAYLLPVDGFGTDVATGYSLDNLYTELGCKPAKSVVVLLDACFSGAKRDGGMLASARGVAIKAKQNEPKGNMVVISAAQGDETAYPYKDKGHGIFTYYLLKKLQETKGDVTYGELADYVTAEVRKQSIVINGKMQTPTATAAGSAVDWRSWKLRR